MPIGPARMPILAHIGELRRRLVVIVVCMVISLIALYLVAPQLTEFLKQPIKEFLPNDGQLYTLGAFEGFSLKVRVALFASFVVCSPIIFWEILAFFMPALKPKEQKFVLPTFFVAVILFVIGMIFCYMFCLGPAFQWLTGESNSIADVLPQAQNYIHYVMLFLIAFGCAFELPLIVFYLVWFDVIPYKKLRQSWRVVYVVLLVFSAMVTPDASPVTMGIMFAALIFLYELSLACARIGMSRRIKRNAEEAKRREEAEAAGEDY